MNQLVKIMKQLVLVIGILISSLASAQCPVFNVIMESQSDVDSFQEVYPNCTEIFGDLTISNESLTDPITNLDGLANISTIFGSLIIQGYGYEDPESGEVVPGDLTGLSALTSVNAIDIRSPYPEDYNVEFGNHILSLEPLGNIQGALVSIEIERSMFYDELPSFDGVTLLGRFSYIESNGATSTPTFPNLEGLEYLTVNGDPDSENSLQTVYIPDGIANIGSISNQYLGTTVVIGDNPDLQTISGGQNLEIVQGVVLRNNESLSDLSGFENVTDVMYLNISSCNPSEFESFENLESANHTFFLFGESLSLDQGVGEMCDNSADNLVIRVGEEADGFVVKGIETGLPPGMFIVASNVGSLEVSSNLKKTSNLRIDTKNVLAMSGFYALDSIYSPEGFNNLILNDPSYPALPAFGNLTFVNGDIAIDLGSEESGLESLEGLGSLEEVEGNILVDGNDLAIDHPFESMDGLSSIQRVGGTIRLHELVNLESIAGIQSAEEIYQLHIRSAPQLEMDFSFENLVALERLYLKNVGASTIPSLNETDFIHSIYLVDNMNLENTNGLAEISQLNVCTISNNPELVSVLMDFNIELNGDLTLTENPSLVNCGQSLTICQLLATAESVEIGENGIGCNDVMAINEACSLIVGTSDASGEESLTGFFDEQENIVLSGDISGLHAVQVYDINGKLMVSNREMFSGERIEIPAGILSPGLYLVSVISDNSRFNIKLVKEE